MIKVLIVDDSPTMREFLTGILSADPGIRIVATARDGSDALEFLAHTKPDVITMDVTMPGMDGFETTRRIMEMCPLPIVIVSAVWKPKEVETVFRAMEAGAVAVAAKPSGLGNPDFEVERQKLIETVKLMAQVKVVRRWAIKEIPKARESPKLKGPVVLPKMVRCVAIGASTGGPMVLRRILSLLPCDYPAPILIVQHITPGFLPGLASWLGSSTGHPVCVATHDDSIQAGRVYLAPDGFQMGVSSGRIKLSTDGFQHGVKPSVSYLFRSIGEAYGEEAIGVLLTGMGKDGAAELLSMKERGAITVAQNKESSVVHGMPGEAIRLGGATHVLSPEKIACLLTCIAIGDAPDPLSGNASVQEEK